MSAAASLDAWIARELQYAAGAMMRSVSRVDLVKSRPGFGTEIRAAKGSIIASPVLASYDPDPDYFFHWYRDSAVVLEAMRVLHADGVLGDDETFMHLRDFAQFSLALGQLDGMARVDDDRWRSRVAPDFVQFLRDADELAAVRQHAVAAETRVNPDGTLDISRWARPQHDGPPLRAIALLGWVRNTKLDAALQAALTELIRRDLDFTLHHWHEPSYDIWEEEQGLHYYTLRVSAAALEQGAAWLRAQSGDAALAERCVEQAQAIRQRLDGFWLEEAGHFRSRILGSGQRSAKELDIAVILSAIHSFEADAATPHSVRDARMQATLQVLEQLFERLYAINRDRPAKQAPALGRYEGDVYYSGGAYFFSTLGAAEFCFRVAQDASLDRLRADAWIARGDAYLHTVRAYAGAQGELSEQFDQNDGEQTSARHLAWSYAAFICTIAARRRALSGR